MNQFLTTLGSILPFFEGQENAFLNANVSKILENENARLGKKLNRTVNTPEDLAAFARVMANLVCAEEEALTK